MKSTGEMKAAVLRSWREDDGSQLLHSTSVERADGGWRVKCTFDPNRVEALFRFERFGPSSGWGGDGRGAPGSRDVTEAEAAAFLLGCGR